MPDFWHQVAHRTGWLKAGTFLTVFIVLYAIAISAFFNVANNTDPEASFAQPKLSAAQKTAGTTDITKAANFSGTLNIYMVQVDPAQTAVTFAYNYIPSDKFLGYGGDDPDNALRLNRNVKFAFGSTGLTQYNAGDESYGSQLKFPGTLTAEGIYAFYPTDTYTFKGLSITCRFAEQPEDAEAQVQVSPKSSPACSFGLTVRSNIKTTFSMDVSDKTGSTTKNAADGLSYELAITISRPFMFRLYPGYVIFAFWLIIIIQLSLIFMLCFFDFRKVEFGCVGLFSGLIFALPSFRNSMPLAPPFGSLSDWISFFWAEGFAVLGLCILGTKFAIPSLTLQP